MQWKCSDISRQERATTDSIQNAAAGATAAQPRHAYGGFKLRAECFFRLCPVVAQYLHGRCPDNAIVCGPGP